jgi:hypothetical protein
MSEIGSRNYALSQRGTMPIMKRISEGPTFLRRWGPAILMMVIIFTLSSIPSDEMPDFGAADLGIKKLGHMLGYALLANAFLFALGGDSPYAVWAALGLTVLYALSDELHQAFVPGRNASLLDVGIDTLGGVLGILPFLVLRRRRIRQESSQA